MEQQRDGIAQVVEQDGIADVADPSRLPEVHVSLRVSGMAPRCWNCGVPLSGSGRLLVTRPTELATEVDRIIDRRELIMICEHCDAMLVRIQGEINWSC